MQKTYRDYTVGELLDMGFIIDVQNHNTKTKREAYEVIGKLGGLKSKSYKINEGKPREFEVIKGHNKKFTIANFIQEK
ncbi:hypothetical protein [Oceanobacillus alkalisoli]|uniref:hypothetical protein n=1 Tax=Oceanobacillus alkalisoli TaxID=2925113 RepID=UPI001F11BAB1|nr:hypothetical protein [Oceanobacillus alkalisoli]MCF3942171.1 hypothetical protein [Oceanobacillus alkalisoli]